MSGNRLPVTTSEKSTRPASRSSRLMFIVSSSVIIHDLHVPGRGLSPFKTYPPLIVDADTVLSTPVAMQCFKPITGGLEALFYSQWLHAAVICEIMAARMLWRSYKVP